MPNRTHSLDETWSLTWQERREQADLNARPREPRIDARVPGDVHLALMAAGRIEDPMIADNNCRIRWIADQEWWWSIEFSKDEPLGRAQELEFLGLDLEADVWLNGRHLGTHRNAFRPLRLDVTGLLDSRNELVVRLLPHTSNLEHVSLDHDLATSFGEKLNAIPREAKIRRPWMRKMPCSFGWNWTTDLATCGIWRPVRLHLIDDVLIEASYVRTLDVDKTAARLQAQCRTRSFLGRTTSARLVVEVARGDKPRKVVARTEATVLLAPGMTEHACELDLAEPALWWPAGLGPQPLYGARVRLDRDEKELAATAIRFGVRSVELDESPRPEQDAYQFRLRVNGVPVFLKGANWIPADICPARLTPARYERLLRLATKAHCNYLRVWGGGIYEDPVFYRLCDELGILVWQDFMYSCAEYPDFDPAFMEEITRETQQVIEDLRAHPCLAIWCGNNEIDQQRDSQAWRQLRPHGRYYGEVIFKHLIPGLLAQLDPDRPYVNSSGCRGTHAPATQAVLDYRSGAVHGDVFTELWSDKPDKQIPSLLNEWYSGAPPVEASLDRFLPAEARHWSHPVWQLHDFLTGQRNFAQDIADRVVPLDGLAFAERAHVWQVFQAESIKAVVEVLRKHKDVCAGSGYWMYDDAYTAGAKSVVDYYGTEKPAFFAMRRAHAPVLPVMERRGDLCEIALVNDTRERREGRLHVEVLTFDGESLVARERAVRVSANAAKTVLRLPAGRIERPTESVLWLTYQENGRTLAENRYYFASIKDLRLPLARVAARVRSAGKDRSRITLRSDHYARHVSLAAPDPHADFSDNYFDLRPGRDYTIPVDRCMRAEDLSLDWENREIFAPTVLKAVPAQIRCVAGGETRFTVEVYNPDRAARAMPVRVSSPASWSGSVEGGQSPLAPRTARVLTVRLTAPVGAWAQEHVQVGLTVDVDGRAHTAQVRVVVDPPLALSVTQRNNGLHISAENRSRETVQDLVLSAAYEHQGVQTKATEPASVPPGASAAHRVRVPGSSAPYSLVVTAQAPDLPPTRTSPWLKGAGAEFLAHLPTQPIPDRPPLRARPAPEASFPALHQAVGYRLSPEAQAEAVNPSQDCRGEAWLFLHYTTQHLIVDAFTRGPALPRTLPQVPTHRQASLELAVSCSDAPGFEGCLGLTPSGPTVAVRIERGMRETARVTTRAFLFVHHVRSARLVHYRYALPWDQVAQGFQTRKGARVRAAFVFNLGHEQYISLYRGIHGRKEPARYGEALLE